MPPVRPPPAIGRDFWLWAPTRVGPRKVLGRCLAIDGCFWTMRVQAPPPGVRAQVVVMERDIIAELYTGRGPDRYSRVT